jgi:ABC-type branched-subunit amino acid transport system ATPase component
VRAITGLESFSGSITFSGKNVRKHKPEALLRDGLVMVPKGAAFRPHDGTGKPADGRLAQA